MDKKINFKYRSLKNYLVITRNCKEEILKLYEQGMKCAIFDYILKDPVERERLGIETYPAKYGVHVICAPTPWHATYITFKHILEEDLFIVNIVMTEIRDLWNRE